MSKNKNATRIAADAFGVAPVAKPDVAVLDIELPSSNRRWNSAHERAKARPQSASSKSIVGTVSDLRHRLGKHRRKEQHGTAGLKNEHQHQRQRFASSFDQISSSNTNESTKKQAKEIGENSSSDDEEKDERGAREAEATRDLDKEIAGPVLVETFSSSSVELDFVGSPLLHQQQLSSPTIVNVQQQVSILPICTERDLLSDPSTLTAMRSKTPQLLSPSEKDPFVANKLPPRPASAMSPVSVSVTVPMAVTPEAGDEGGGRPLSNCSFSSVAGGGGGVGSFTRATSSTNIQAESPASNNTASPRPDLVKDETKGRMPSLKSPSISATVTPDSATTKVNTTIANSNDNFNASAGSQNQPASRRVAHDPEKTVRFNCYGERLYHGVTVDRVLSNQFYRFRGTYIDGEREGEGILKCTDGSSIHGHFEKGEIEGQGIKYWPDGTSYRGEFHLGEPEGFGETTYPNGERYVGNFHLGHRHGQGGLLFKHYPRKEEQQVQILENQQEAKKEFEIPEVGGEKSAPASPLIRPSATNRKKGAAPSGLGGGGAPPWQSPLPLGSSSPRSGGVSSPTPGHRLLSPGGVSGTFSPSSRNASPRPSSLQHSILQQDAKGGDGAPSPIFFMHKEASSDPHFEWRKYQGQFENHKFQGKGTLHTNDATLTGTFEQDILHGPGEATYLNGDTYKGEFVNGLPHGHGVWFNEPSGVTYEGNFRKGKRTEFPNALYVTDWTLGAGAEGKPGNPMTTTLGGAKKVISNVPPAPSLSIVQALRVELVNPISGAVLNVKGGQVEKAEDLDLAPALPGPGGPAGNRGLAGASMNMVGGSKSLLGASLNNVGGGAVRSPQTNALTTTATTPVPVQTSSSSVAAAPTEAMQIPYGTTAVSLTVGLVTMKDPPAKKLASVISAATNLAAPMSVGSRPAVGVVGGGTRGGPTTFAPSTATAGPTTTTNAVGGSTTVATHTLIKKHHTDCGWEIEMRLVRRGDVPHQGQSHGHGHGHGHGGATAVGQHGLSPAVQQHHSRESASTAANEFLSAASSVNTALPKNMQQSQSWSPVPSAFAMSLSTSRNPNKAQLSASGSTQQKNQQNGGSSGNLEAPKLIPETSDHQGGEKSLREWGSQRSRRPSWGGKSVGFTFSDEPSPDSESGSSFTGTPREVLTPLKAFASKAQGGGSGGGEYTAAGVKKQSQQSQQSQQSRKTSFMYRASSTIFDHNSDAAYYGPYNAGCVNGGYSVPRTAMGSLFCLSAFPQIHTEPDELLFFDPTSEVEHVTKAYKEHAQRYQPTTATGKQKRGGGGGGGGGFQQGLGADGGDGTGTGTPGRRPMSAQRRLSLSKQQRRGSDDRRGSLVDSSGFFDKPAVSALTVPGVPPAWTSLETTSTIFGRTGKNGKATLQFRPIPTIDPGEYSLQLTGTLYVAIEPGKGPVPMSMPLKDCSLPIKIVPHKELWFIPPKDGVGYGSATNNTKSRQPSTVGGGSDFQSGTFGSMTFSPLGASGAAASSSNPGKALPSKR